MCPIILIVILLLVVLYMVGNKNNMSDFQLETDNISNAYHNMETGDLILLTDNRYDIKSVRIIFKDTQEKVIGYIRGDKDGDGHLKIDTLHNLAKENKDKDKHILWLRLLESLNNDKLWALKHTLRTLYTNQYNVGINTVFIYNKNKRDFFNCPIYCAKLLHDMGILKFNNPTCFSDPSECIQQFYKNSAFINADEFYSTEHLVKLI